MLNKKGKELCFEFLVWFCYKRTFKTYLSCNSVTWHQGSQSHKSLTHHNSCQESDCGKLLVKKLYLIWKKNQPHTFSLYYWINSYFLGVNIEWDLLAQASSLLNWCKTAVTYYWPLVWFVCRLFCSLQIGKKDETPYYHQGKDILVLLA